MSALADIGNAIAASRKLRRLTQAEVARAAHVSLSTLKALEAHRGDEIGFTKLTRLLAVLGMELRLQPITPRRPTLEEILAEEAEEDFHGEAEP